MKGRLKVVVRGAVQGVGFRPFVHNLATELDLAGWVCNDPHGVRIEVEGPSGVLEDFLLRLTSEKPPLAVIQSLEPSHHDPKGHRGFTIRASRENGIPTAFISPDSATCDACRRELFDPADRRHRYPFLNCTHCGPRYSILESLPYDRSRTTMRGFLLCPACEQEYHNPADRRFHAQPVACPDCGPQLSFWDDRGEPLAEREHALQCALDLIRTGRILAVKGLGGFHLMVDARDEKAVCRLRERKCREEKPLAVMFPSVESITHVCKVSALEQRLLNSPEAPIVLLERSTDLSTAPFLAPSLAPGNRSLGVMLPYTPLHHLLLHDLDFPVVATSGNRVDEPICIDEAEALERLRNIADGFLVHNRPILRRVDDSIVRVLLGRECVLRRARGFAPLPLRARAPLPTVLALGAHQKSTVALSRGEYIFVSQHLGDLESPQALSAFRSTAGDLPRLYRTKPEVVACDPHPDYPSSDFARKSGRPRVEVQHHLAHILSCMLDNEIDPPVLGVAWDGTGLGEDGSIWGGEFLLVEENSWERVAHLRRFRLPGGDAAAREPWRCALGLLHEIQGKAAFTDAHPAALRRMLEQGIHSPWTSSAGRLFDGVASLLGIRDRSSFEGQAAMELEQAAGDGAGIPYPVPVGKVVDWQPMIEAMLKDPSPVAVRAARFHQSLTRAIVQVAQRAGPSRVVLSGGCFQNRLLVELTDRQLREQGFQPYWHQRIPPNDGGISVGQIAGAARALRNVSEPTQPETEPCALPFQEK
jgi:hydrogenase maturation protein HypF